jgi:hypothetical protein
MMMATWRGTLAVSEVHQDKGAGFAVVGLIHPLNPRQGTTCNAYVVARLEHTRDGCRRRFAQKVDEFSGHLGRYMTKADQLAHAQGGADGGPVVVDVIQADEEIAAEHGLAHAADFLAANFFNLHHGQEAFKALVDQVFERSGFLTGFAMNSVPSSGGFVCVCHVFTFEEFTQSKGVG